MKKTLMLCPLLAIMAFVGVETKNVAAETASADWVVTSNGSEPTTVYDTANGYMIDHVNNYGETGYFNKMVPLDGLSFDIRSENMHDADAFGFYLSNTKATGTTSWTTPSVVIWKGLYSGQTRVVISDSHDYNGAAKVHVSPSADAAVGFGVAGSAVMSNDSSITSAGINISFAKYDEQWYSITMKSIDSQGFWGNNANYNSEDGSTTVYIAVADMIGNGIDANGKTYIHYAGIRSGANASTSDIAIHIENLKYNKKEDAINVINAVSVENYAEEDRAAIEAAKTTALQEVEAAVDEAGINAALEKFNTEIGKYMTKDEKYIHTIYENAPETMKVMDKTANFTDYYNYGYSAVRLNDEGGFVAKLLGGYGQRGAIANQYDPKNFEMSLNLAKAKTGTTTVLSINNDACGYINDTQIVFGMDIIKLDETRFFVTFTNSGDHNISVEGFNTESWSAYTGRNITAINGDINIKVSTVGNVSTVTINDVTVDLDTTTVFAHQTAEKAYFSLGIMTTDANELVAVTKIKDATEEEYLATGTFAQVSTKLDAIETAIKDGITNEIYKEQFDTPVFGSFTSNVAHLQALAGYLHGYDQEYFRSRIDAIVAAGEAYKPTYDVQTFITDWRELRDASGSICNALTDQANLNALFTRYDALTDAEKATVDAATDVDGITIKESMDYLRSVINGTTKTEGNYGITPTESASNILTEVKGSSTIVILVAVLGVIAISAYYFIEKRKLAK